MRKILFSILLIAACSVALSFSAIGQGRGMRGGGPGGPMGDMLFQGQPPPPGAVSVLGRSFFGALDNGFGNSLALIMSADNQNVRQELGMTDAEANSIRLLRVQMLMNAPKYAERFKNMTEDDQKGLQDDLERDLAQITESLNKAVPPERHEKVQKLVFQSLGGIDSPMINLNSMETLNLSDDQRQKLQSVFDEMKEERTAQMEAMLAIAEKAIALGGPNMSQEDRDQLRKEGEELQAKVQETGAKLSERLRQHLTPAQLEQEKQLLASRPAFLPRLPNQNRQQEAPRGFTPGPNSWRPGQELPEQPPPKQEGGQFPSTDE